LTNVAKEGLKLDGDDEDVKDSQIEEDYKPLLDYLKQSLVGKISKAQLSTQLVSTPSAIISGSYGFTANMERLMKAQAFTDKKQFSYMKSQRILEVNPKHPLIHEFLRRVSDPSTDQVVLADLSLLLYDTASLNSGFSLDDPPQFATRIHRMMKLSLNIDPYTEVEEESHKESVSEDASTSTAKSGDDDSTISHDEL